MICATCANRILRKFNSASESTDESYCKLDGFKIPMFGRVLVECSAYEEKKVPSFKKG